MPKSLTEFSQEWKPNGSGPKAWISSIPEYDELVEAWKTGVSCELLRSWLIKERGYPAEVVTRNRVCKRLNELFPRG